MSYVQLVNPNLGTVGKIGWCLSFVQDAFDTPHLYPTAIVGWENTQLKHEDRDLPDARVPVWFEYYLNGKNYGHVAIWVPGRGILSSPFKKDGTQHWFTSIDDCARVLNCKYLGWSEDLSNIRLVASEGGKGSGEITMSPTRRAISADEAVAHFKNFAGRDDVKPTDQVCQNRFIDPESDEFFYGLLVHTRDLRIANEQRANNALSELNIARSDLVSKLSGQVNTQTLIELQQRLTNCQQLLEKTTDTANTAVQTNKETTSILTKIIAFFMNKKS